jgi:hypothetical protein
MSFFFCKTLAEGAGVRFELQPESDYVHRYKVGATHLQFGLVDTPCGENFRDQRRLEGAQILRADSRGLVVNDEYSSVRLFLLVQVDLCLFALVSRPIAETVIQSKTDTVSIPESNCGRQKLSCPA